MEGVPQQENREPVEMNREAVLAALGSLENQIANEQRIFEERMGAMSSMVADLRTQINDGRRVPPQPDFI